MSEDLGVIVFKTWCPGLDLNQHEEILHKALNLACLPIPPPGQFVKKLSRILQQARKTRNKIHHPQQYRNVLSG